MVTDVYLHYFFQYNTIVIQPLCFQVNTISLLVYLSDSWRTSMQHLSGISSTINRPQLHRETMHACNIMYSRTVTGKGLSVEQFI